MIYINYSRSAIIHHSGIKNLIMWQKHIETVGFIASMESHNKNK